MSKVLIVGCGDLGTAIAMGLQQSHEVIGLRQSSQLLPNGMQTIQADVTRPNTLKSLEKLNPNIIVYCVSAGGQTDEKYQAAYVTGLKNILATQSQNTNLQHVFLFPVRACMGKITQKFWKKTCLQSPPILAENVY